MVMRQRAINSLKSSPDSNLFCSNPLIPDTKVRQTPVRYSKFLSKFNCDQYFQEYFDELEQKERDYVSMPVAGQLNKTKGRGSKQHINRNCASSATSGKKGVDFSLQF